MTPMGDAGGEGRVGVHDEAGVGRCDFRPPTLYLHLSQNTPVGARTTPRARYAY
ncbi:hypothetical protein K523DRAFT_358756 [Schizophyllum commune Tattone D]|nr:hypothetical protein K523DRAFT_358756 [Schizophyllum commune Tattone D]